MEVTFDLLFGVTQGEVDLGEWRASATFHDVDLQVDAILGYPWLRKQHIGVFPHLSSLALLTDPIMLLRDWVPPSEPFTTPKQPSAGEGFKGGEDHQAYIAQARAMGLTLPTQAGAPEEGLFEDEDTLAYIATQLSHAEREAQVQGVILVPEGEGEGDEEVKRLIENIHKDYDGEVLCEKVPPGPRPVRGPFGEGEIELKPGARAKKQRPIPLTGERREAMIKLVEEWENEGKVEDGASEWSSPAFVVAKKGGKWRGVVDFRALNEMTIPDSHPLPRIEDILVQ